VPKGTHERGFACCIHAMHGEDTLCQIDANGYDSHGTSPSNKSGELMNSLASPSWHVVAENRKPQSSRLAWDGEVPFIH
jgi:hypothetical protein